MSVRHVLSLTHLCTDDLLTLARRSVDFASGRTDGAAMLAGRTVGIYFRRSSTRTRTSFTVGAMKLGADTVIYGPNDLQLTTGETLQDTGRVLSGYLDALVVRTNDSQAEMEALAEQDEMAVVNAMSAEEHPTQAIADLSTLLEAFGHLEGIRMLYLGEGNNTASALGYAFSKLPGTRLTLITPPGYGLPPEQLERARSTAGEHGSTIEQHHDVDALPEEVDVVYTTRWQTMGTPRSDPDWRDRFRPYTVTQELMDRVSRPGRTVFLHDLPAVRGDDVVDEVLDGPQSLAWRQARHKMWSAMAILEWCLTTR